MFNFIVNLLQAIFSLIFKKEKDIIFTILMLKKENEILKRHSSSNNQKLNLKMNDRFLLSIIGKLSKRALLHLSLVRPETLLKWQRQFIKKKWTFNNKKKGRPYIKKEIKDLILEMKQDNRFWGCRKIADELKKLEIDVHFTTIDFSQYGITGISTSPYAPNMNAHVERVIGTIRREALDHFLLFSEKQVYKIIKEFVHFYNNYRTHQGIDRIPNGDIPVGSGSIRKESILSGTHHHYYRSSA